MKIGYQGIPGSYTVIAAKQLASNAGIYNAEYVPLDNSEDIISALMKGDINYGVVAVYDSVDGEVTETSEALKNADYMKVTAAAMPIHQCIFKANRYVKDADINKIVSHVQSSDKTKNAVKRHFPYARFKSVEDTAIGARNLSEGVYDKYTAVVCSKEAGDIYGLTMMYENIEDESPNCAVFNLITKAV